MTSCPIWVCFHIFMGSIQWNAFLIGPEGWIFQLALVRELPIFTIILNESYTAEANNMWIIYATESSLSINRTFRMCIIHYLKSTGTVNQLCQIFRTILKVVQQCVGTINQFKTLIEHLRKLKKSSCFLFSIFSLFWEKYFCYFLLLFTSL